jgi:hypothetical protein
MQQHNSTIVRSQRCTGVFVKTMNLIILRIVAALLLPPLTVSALRTDDRRRQGELNSETVGRLIKFRLVNASIGSHGEPIIDPLGNSRVIHLKNYASDQAFGLEVVRDNSTDPIGSVRFSLSFDGRTTTRVNNTLPFSLC